MATTRDGAGKNAPESTENGWAIRFIIAATGAPAAIRAAMTDRYQRFER